jgi:hypothetical protein
MKKNKNKKELKMNYKVGKMRENNYYLKILKYKMQQ